MSAGDYTASDWIRLLEIYGDGDKRLTLDPERCRRAARELRSALFEQGTEEPEWEYGNEQLMHSHVEVFPASSEAVANAQAWLYPVRRRRKAGPWEPVKP